MVWCGVVLCAVEVLNSLLSILTDPPTQNACNKRRYQYLLPTFMLASPAEIAAVLDRAALPPGQDGGGGGSVRQSWGANKLPAHVAAAAAGSLSAYRVPKETLGRLRRVLGGFVGTRNFHNYTSKMKATDGAAKRFIISFDADEPFVREVEEGGTEGGTEGGAQGARDGEGGSEGGSRSGCEWVMLTVVGQSFLLHQIR